MSSNKQISSEEILNPGGDLAGYIDGQTAANLEIEQHYYSVWGHYNSGNSVQIFVPLDNSRIPYIRVIRPTESYDINYPLANGEQTFYSILPSELIDPNVSKEYGEIYINTYGKIAFVTINVLIINYSGQSVNIFDLPTSATPKYAVTITGTITAGDNTGMIDGIARIAVGVDRKVWVSVRGQSATDFYIRGTAVCLLN